MSAKAYDVFLNGKLIDTVWFTGYTAEEARKSLIEHDGYDPRILVSSANRFNKRYNNDEEGSTTGRLP